MVYQGIGKTRFITLFWIVKPIEDVLSLSLSRVVVSDQWLLSTFTYIERLFNGVI